MRRTQRVVSVGLRASRCSSCVYFTKYGTSLHRHPISLQSSFSTSSYLYRGTESDTHTPQNFVADTSSTTNTDNYPPNLDSFTSYNQVLNAFLKYQTNPTDFFRNWRIEIPSKDATFHWSDHTAYDFPPQIVVSMKGVHRKILRTIQIDWDTGMMKCLYQDFRGTRDPTPFVPLYSDMQASYDVMQLVKSPDSAVQAEPYVENFDGKDPYATEEEQMENLENAQYGPTDEEFDIENNNEGDTGDDLYDFEEGDEVEEEEDFTSRPSRFYPLTKHMFGEIKIPSDWLLAMKKQFWPPTLSPDYEDDHGLLFSPDSGETDTVLGKKEPKHGQLESYIHSNKRVTDYGSRKEYFDIMQKFSKPHRNVDYHKQKFYEKGLASDRKLMEFKLMALESGLSVDTAVKMHKLIPEYTQEVESLSIADQKEYEIAISVAGNPGAILNERQRFVLWNIERKVEKRLKVHKYPYRQVRTRFSPKPNTK